MTTIAIRLMGGLGNQLFQWALAKQFAHLGRRVVLDPRLVHSVEIAPLLGQTKLSAWPSCGLRVGRKLGINRSATNYHWIGEPRFSYWDGVFLESGSRILLDGYWQTPRYFGPIEEEIREDLRVWGNNCLTPAGVELGRMINAGATASVHVRKGDYVTSAAVRAHHGVLPDEYFLQAMAELSRAGIERFVIFSDDLSMARQLFAKRSDCVVVDRSLTVLPMGEIRLMSLCAAHVLSNSSFSWWGAWLEDSESSRVIAPVKWFRNGTQDTSDLIPAGWLRGGPEVE